jgi:hypothetical protein
MRAFAAVFAREVFARRLVFPVAFAAGFVPLLGSLAYGWSRTEAAEGRVLVALVTASAFSLAFAILFGGSVIAGETSEKRISFFFSRPISAAAIWGGKVLAVLVLTLVPAALALVPAFAAGTSGARQGVVRLGGAPGAVFGIFFVVLVLIFGAHATVTIARLRSPWVALDLLLAPVLVLLVATFFGTLMKHGIATLPLRGFELSPVLPMLAAAVLAALAAASYAQVAAGRTDARRSHGAFSAVLWGILGAVTAALGGYTWWVASAKATNLVTVEGGVSPAPRGAWVAAGGPLGAGRGSGLFLADTAGNRSLRIRSGDTVFSGDGARAAWTEERFGFLERERKSDLFVADLASAKAVVETGLTCGVWCRVALSPSGRRLAVLDGNTIGAYEISDASNPRQLAAFPVSDGSRGFAFVDEDTIRLFPRFYNAVRKDVASAALEITELSLPSKKSSVTGRFEREALPRLRMSADGQLFVGVLEKRLTLHDGKTGALLATLSEDLASPRMRFLSGSRVAVAGIVNSRAEMKIFLESEKGWGPLARSIDLGPAASVLLGGEIAPGRVAVALNPFQRNSPSSESRSAWRLAFVELATGAVSPGPDGLVPADRFAWWFSATLPPAEAGLSGASLFLDASSRLVRLDPATGAETVLLGRSK